MSSRFHFGAMVFYSKDGTPMPAKMKKKRKLTAIEAEAKKVGKFFRHLVKGRRRKAVTLLREILETMNEDDDSIHFQGIEIDRRQMSRMISSIEDSFEGDPKKRRGCRVRVDIEMPLLPEMFADTVQEWEDEQEDEGPHETLNDFLISQLTLYFSRSLDDRFSGDHDFDSKVNIVEVADDAEEWQRVKPKKRPTSDLGPDDEDEDDDDDVERDE